MEGHASPHIVKRRLGQRLFAHRSTSGFDDERDPVDDQLAIDSSFVHTSPGKGSFVEPYYQEPEQNGYGHVDVDFPFDYDGEDDLNETIVDYVDDDVDRRNGTLTPVEVKSTPSQAGSPATLPPLDRSRHGPGLCFTLSTLLTILFALLLAASFNPNARDYVRHNISAPVADAMERVPNPLHFTFPLSFNVFRADSHVPPIINFNITGDGAETLMIEFEKLHRSVKEIKNEVGGNAVKTEDGAQRLAELVTRLEALERKIGSKAEQDAIKELKLALAESSAKTENSLKEHKPVIEATAKDAAKAAVQEWAASNSGIAVEEAKTAAKQAVDEALKDLPTAIDGLADLEELKALRKEFESLTEQVMQGEEGVIEKVLKRLEQSPVFQVLEDAVTSVQHTVAKLNDRVPSQAKDIVQLQEELKETRTSLTSLQDAQTSSDEKARAAREARESLVKEIEELQKSVIEIDQVSTRLLTLTEEFGKFKVVVEATNTTHMLDINQAVVDRLALDEKIENANVELLETKRDIMQELNKVAKEARSQDVQLSAFGGSNLQPQIEAIIERYYYGERDEEVDWASENLGGTIKATSKPIAQFGDFVKRTPAEAILRPMSSEPRCYQMAGNDGWVVFVTPRGLRPQKFVVEYPKGIYPSREAFGREFELYGSTTNIGAASRGDQDAFVKLHDGTLETTQAGGYFSIELDASRASDSSLNIPVAPAGASDTDGMKLEGPIYDIFRLNILSNHGADGMTCLFRIRLYGQAMTGLGWRSFRESGRF